MSHRWMDVLRWLRECGTRKDHGDSDRMNVIAYLDTICIMR